MIAFSIFGISIYWYGIFYAIAFLFAYVFLYTLAYKKVFINLYPSLHHILVSFLDDIFLYSILGVIVGGRLGHILIYDFSYYILHPLDIFMIWKGGMSFIGGIIGVIVFLSFFIWKHKIKTVDFFALGDLLFIPTSFGIAIGRIGNFLNQELYGIPVPDYFVSQYPSFSSWMTNLLLFHKYSNIDSLLRVNTNLISSLFEGFLLFILLFILLLFQSKRKNRKPGYIVGIFFVVYSSFRFIFEYIRADSQLEFVGLFTKSQWFFLVFIILGGLFLSFRKKIFNQR